MLYNEEYKRQILREEYDRYCQEEMSFKDWVKLSSESDDGFAHWLFEGHPDRIDEDNIPDDLYALTDEQEQEWKDFLERLGEDTNLSELYETITGKDKIIRSASDDLNEKFKSDVIEAFVGNFDPFEARYDFGADLRDIAKKELKMQSHGNLYKVYLSEVMSHGCASGVVPSLISSPDCEELVTKHLDDYLLYLGDLSDELDPDIAVEALSNGVAGIAWTAYERYITSLVCRALDIEVEDLFKEVLESWAQEDVVNLITHLPPSMDCSIGMSDDEEDALLEVFANDVLYNLNKEEQVSIAKYISENTQNKKVIDMIVDYTKDNELNFSQSMEVGVEKRIAEPIQKKRGGFKM